jgi:hypothetical protein
MALKHEAATKQTPKSFLDLPHELRQTIFTQTYAILFKLLSQCHGSSDYRDDLRRLERLQGIAEKQSARLRAVHDDIIEDVNYTEAQWKKKWDISVEKLRKKREEERDARFSEHKALNYEKWSSGEE